MQVQTKIQVSIPLETLSQAIKALSLDNKFRLLKILDQQTANEEANDPEIRAEIEASRAEVADGKFVTLDELLAEIEND